MRFLPGLTTTDPASFDAFFADLADSGIREIAFFPTCLERAAREEAYGRLEAIEGLRIPHVHIRNDMGKDELALLAERFGTEVFNIHARNSKHPYSADPGRWKSSIFVENADAVPVEDELSGYGGLCVDYAHWESARLMGRDAPYRSFGELASRVAIGCCHVSAVRPGVLSSWGGYDHHRFETAADLDYVLRYRDFLPGRWASLELENPLAEQLAAIARLESLLAV